MLDRAAVASAESSILHAGCGTPACAQRQCGLADTSLADMGRTHAALPDGYNDDVMQQALPLPALGLDIDQGRQAWTSPFLNATRALLARATNPVTVAVRGRDLVAILRAKGWQACRSCACLSLRTFPSRAHRPQHRAASSG